MTPDMAHIDRITLMITSRRAKAKAPRSAEYCSTPRGDMWASMFTDACGIMAVYGYMLSNLLLSARVGRRPVT